MKNSVYVSLLILATLFSQLLPAQDYEGSWLGSTMGLPLIFEIVENDGNYSAKMQSPKQSEVFLPMDTVSVADGKLYMTLSSFKIKYSGELQEGKIVGTFFQGTFSTAMNLENKIYVEVKHNRPQEPKAPFSYKVEEVYFENPKAEFIKLAGTLTLPANVDNPPVAIMITGSGPQDRNEELFDHKPFMVIADHLAKNGIAVLRYDDRGVAQSEGIHQLATSADFATDVEAVITYLKTRSDIDHSKIGLIGHSEGGLIAPIVIAANPRDVAFFISLAGTGVQGSKVLLPQMRKLNAFQGILPSENDYDIAMMDEIFQTIINSEGATQNELQTSIAAIISKNVANAPESLKATYSETFVTQISQQFSDPWFRYFITYDPTDNLEKVKCPVLALNGSLDYQVIPEVNLPAMESAFAKAKNTDVTIKVMPGLNHLFQNATTGSGEEYPLIEETFDPKTLDLMADWINERF